MSPPGRFGDGRRGRIGLLGGSFNPAHAGHLAVAETLRRNLRLQQVWLVVSPGNPLKPRTGMAPLAARLESARGLADGRRIVATAIEAELGTRYSVDTLAALRRRFPRVRFVWLMGADGFAELPRWKQWRRLAAQVPLAVHARPGADRSALHGAAALVLRGRRVEARALALAVPPAWAFLLRQRHTLSATALRNAGLGLKTGGSHTLP